MVVSHFDGKQVPDWEAKVPHRKEKFRLTINSLLSKLSVLGSTCAMIPVTKSLGQLKYLWFMEQDRKLADLEVFDSASRGNFGSAMLIWKLRFKHLAVLGGLASLQALAYGPFVQNLLTFSVDYNKVNQDALLSYSWAYTGTGGSIEVIETPLQYAVGEALQDASVDWAVPALKCKTGDCYWDPYYTIAACSRCTDISHLLTRTCTPMVTNQDDFTETGGCNVALPNGLSLKSTGADYPHRVVMLMNTTMSPLASNYSSPLALVQSIAGYPSEGSTLSKPFMITKDSPLSAHECAIIPCVQQQNLKISPQEAEISGNSLRSDNGVIPSLNITQQWDNYYKDPSGGYVYITFDDPGVNKNIPAQQKDSYGSTPYMEPAAYDALEKYLAEELSGYVYTNPTDTDPESYLPSGGAARTIYSHTVNGTWTSPYCDGNGTTSQQTGVVCGMNKAAAGLTNAFRLQTWQMIDSPNRLNGTTRAPQQICKAQWQYVSAPIAVWALGLVLFIGVVIKTRRANIKAWRTSPLATLLLRLDPDSREHLKDWQNMGDAELKDAAKELRLQLQMDESGPRFVRRTDGPSS